MKKNANALLIDGEMTIYRAAELKQLILQWQGAMAQAGGGAIDLSSVTEIDCCGIQLLALAQRTAADAGCECHLVNPSPPVADAFRLLNFGQMAAAQA